MAVQTTYPGVYIDEFAPGAPIEGVGTSTAAFIGLAAEGEYDHPLKLTSWDQFLAEFGALPVPGFYLWYAVRGFFENGGQVCYVVRASNGTYDEWDFPVRGTAGGTALHARARQPGVSGITLNVNALNVMPAGAVAYQPSGQVGTVVNLREITLGAGEGAQFRPADMITLGGSATPVAIVRVSGDTLRLAADPSPAAAVNDRVILAPFAAGGRTLRLDGLPNPLPVNSLVPGSILTVDATGQASGGIDTQVVDAVQAEFLGGGTVTYRVTFREGLRSGFSLDPNDAQVTLQSEEFSIDVTLGAVTTTYDNLGFDPIHPRYVLRVLRADGARLIEVTRPDPPPPLRPPDNLPAAGAPTQTSTGTAEDLTTFGDQDLIDALDTLREIDDVNMVSIPDCMAGLPGVTAANVQQAIITHCEQMADRFAVLDALAPVAGQPLFGTGSVDEQRNGLDTERGYAALYYPWLQVRPAGRGDPVLVPPSGHVCGIFARSDNSKGVHKAPANELVNGALGVQRQMSDVDQGQLNIRGVNVLRVFGGGGRVTLWGARTTATNRNWQYVNVRRLFLYCEESIQEGIRWAVFEPNNQALWKKLKRTLTDFLTVAWRDGALFGAKAEEAFYVRIDEQLNPFSEQQLGRLHIEIGVRPSYPAEFIVVRIGIWDGGSDVSES
ncbi:MAG TPA: phage tail sheath subtilisin-like domain-containing protein [Gemmatimonadales bacterium]|nr:phage tail sheath subtilisin-like domain-containing protein [Gemmatimonadales bacterium]